MRKETKKNRNDSEKIYGLDPDMSLQSVSFATTLNPYLNEQLKEDKEEKE